MPVVGFLVGVTVLVLGQIVLTTVRPPLIRLFIGLIYAVPAAVAGVKWSDVTPSASVWSDWPDVRTSLPDERE